MACQQVTDPACSLVVGDRYDRSCRGAEFCNSWGGIQTVMPPVFGPATSP